MTQPTKNGRPRRHPTPEWMNKIEGSIEIQGETLDNLMDAIESLCERVAALEASGAAVDA